MAALETKLLPVSAAQSGSTVTDVYYTNVNLHIRSGAGATNGPINGRGNLIVGYDEENGDPRTGSHNLVIGRYHSYSSFGGLRHLRVPGHGDAEVKFGVIEKPIRQRIHPP